MQSPFAAWMERLYREHPEHPWIALTDPADLTANPMMAMLSEKGQAAERRFLETEFLADRRRYPNVADLSSVRLYGKKKKRRPAESSSSTTTTTTPTNSPADDAAAATVAAMREGADVIFQAPLVGAGGFGGAAAFVVKKPWDGGARAAGGEQYDYYYEVWDAKFGKRAAPQHMLQLWCYTEMVHGLWNGPRCFGPDEDAASSSLASSSSPSFSPPELILPSSAQGADPLSLPPPPLRACLVLDLALIPI